MNRLGDRIAHGLSRLDSRERNWRPGDQIRLQQGWITLDSWDLETDRLVAITDRGERILITPESLPDDRPMMMAIGAARRPDERYK